MRDLGGALRDNGAMAGPRGAASCLFGLCLAGLLGLALAGCETDMVGAFAGGPTIGAPKPRPVQLFVVSTRQGESGAAEQAFSAQGPGYALEIVTMPPGHRPGTIETPMWGAPNPMNHIAVSDQRPLDPDEFRAELASHVSGRVGVSRDVLVYVHGFNTSFEEARDRAAQIVADSRFGGVAVLFTWPSKHELFGYVSDKDSAMASRDALQGLLQDVAATPGVGKIHVLAHSMGGWLAMEALRQASIAGSRDLSGHLGEVMLASPDIDMDVFAAQMSHLRPANVTVFATANDRALSLSSAIAESRQRVGAINPSNPEDRRKLESLGARVYDLTKFSDGFIDHGAYADAPEVLRAIGGQMAAPRAQDSSQMSIIDASGYADPNAAPPAAASTPEPTPASAPQAPTASPTPAAAAPAAPLPTSSAVVAAPLPAAAPTPSPTPTPAPQATVK
jgi:esterase/lipase superfamily enzyme